MKRVATAIIKRNSIILVNVSKTVEPKYVNLHWWNECAERNNLGDSLSPVIWENMLHYLKITETYGKEKKTYHLYGRGSVIESGYQDAVIRGSEVL